MIQVFVHAGVANLIIGHVKISPLTGLVIIDFNGN